MFKSILLVASAAASTLAFAPTDPFQKYNLSAPGINATFIGYGARLTNLYVNDRNGTAQDVVLGYDDPYQYLKDDATNHTYFGPIVGRYANRIKNGTFTIDGVTSNITKNEHGGLNPLHGGQIGYDQRNWTVVSANTTQITFALMDKEFEGFPGSVLTYATFSVQEKRLTSRMVSIPLDRPTPIMLANHIYWNLDAFVTGPKKNILDNTLYMPYSKRYIEADGILIPTGKIVSVEGTPLDFTKPKKIGTDIANATACGTGCVGYDNAFIIDRPRYSAPEATDLSVLQLASPVTGIAVSVKTNQQSLQIYSCVGQNGTIPVKASQQHGPRGSKTYVEKYGCLVIETQQWIDGINHPEWGQQQYQIYGPDTEPATSYTTYDFSVIKQ